jgi:hypothetical protein
MLKFERLARDITFDGVKDVAPRSANSLLRRISICPRLVFRVRNLRRRHCIVQTFVIDDLLPRHGLTDDVPGCPQVCDGEGGCRIERPS